MNNFNSCIPITIGHDNYINNIAFDGCNFFAVVKNKCEIVKLDTDFKIQHKYSTCRTYDCICYDYCEHCFWASSRNCYNKLYKLDCSMNEMDCITIYEICKYGIITGISYNCCKDSLLVSMTYAVLEVDKYCEKSTVVYFAKDEWIISVTSICPGMLITVLKNNKYYIKVLNKYGEKTECFCIESTSIPVNLIFNPCKCHYPKAELLTVMIKENCYPFGCKSDICHKDLGFHPCFCNYKICNECCCESDPCHNSDPCTDILESIALVETSISHILNAESQKLQKVLEETSDIDKILCVNREINKTIINATHLEHTLYAKLSPLVECGLCCENGDHKCNGKHCCCDDNNICTCDANGGVF